MLVVPTRKNVALIAIDDRKNKRKAVQTKNSLLRVRVLSIVGVLEVKVSMGRGAACTCIESIDCDPFCGGKNDRNQFQKSLQKKPSQLVMFSIFEAVGKVYSICYRR